MGWTTDYRLGVDDWNELRLKGVDRAARQLQGRAQERVQYLITQSKPELIGKNIPIPELDAPHEKQ